MLLLLPKLWPSGVEKEGGDSPLLHNAHWDSLSCRAPRTPPSHSRWRDEQGAPRRSRAPQKEQIRYHTNITVFSTPVSLRNFHLKTNNAPTARAGSIYRQIACAMSRIFKPTKVAESFPLRPHNTGSLYILHAWWILSSDGATLSNLRATTDSLRCPQGRSSNGEGGKQSLSSLSES